MHCTTSGRQPGWSEIVLLFAVDVLPLVAMYNDTVMDHFENPRNTGEIADADGVGTVGNPDCLYTS